MNFNQGRIYVPASIENSRMSSTLYDHLLLDVGDIRGVSIGMTLDRAFDKFCLQM